MKFANERRGASLVVVLALLAVCSTILFQLLTAGLQQRFQLRRDLQREQTQWLLRAGSEYAAAQLKENEAELPKSVTVDLPSFEAAKVVYLKDFGKSDRETMSVSAQIGESDSPHQMTVLSSEFKVPSNSSKSSQE